ncbi:hypothetical protein TNCV_5099691 [Trichonephila clavipes]|uniref:Transposase Tc1-like domain-containing protein n=1 Tax=Trichonephila clavipes TaxID=2585209 RepID=A0A8X6VBR9_TRICX|nr:hypothetical protein TNCV_5099691 [Trichonephila clavipes]
MYGKEEREVPVSVLKDNSKEDINPVVLSKQPVDLDDDDNNKIEKRKARFFLSAQTVRNVLHSAGLKARTPRKKPYISEVNRKRRLEFARKYKNKPMGFWKKDWWCRAGRGNAVKTRRVDQAMVSWPLPKNYSSRSYESSLDGAASECSNK